MLQNGITAGSINV